MARRYTEHDVLDYLDNRVVYNPGGCFFMDLKHPYFYTANSRLSPFDDDANWAIVFDKSGYANRRGRVELELNYFGNRLQNLEPGGLYNRFAYNAVYYTLVDGDALDEISEDSGIISSSATPVRLRDRYVGLPSREEDYVKWVPDILTRNYPKGISFEDLARYLAFEYEDLCRATPGELRTCLPPDLPLLTHVNEWHHREYNNYSADRAPNGDKPSSHETFPLLAEVLVSGDPTRYRPTLTPTHHWSNWPEAGTL